MIQDDFDQVDVDAPIPYRLTNLARRELAAERAMERVASCAHDWRVDLGRGLVCRTCETVTKPRKLGSIPSYLGPRGRR